MWYQKLKLTIYLDKSLNKKCAEQAVTALKPLNDIKSVITCFGKRS